MLVYWIGYLVLTIMCAAITLAYSIMAKINAELVKQMQTVKAALEKANADKWFAEARCDELVKELGEQNGRYMRHMGEMKGLVIVRDATITELERARAALIAANTGMAKECEEAKTLADQRLNELEDANEHLAFSREERNKLSTLLAERENQFTALTVDARRMQEKFAAILAHAIGRDNVEISTEVVRGMLTERLMKEYKRGYEIATSETTERMVREMKMQEVNWEKINKEQADKLRVVEMVTNTLIGLFPLASPFPPEYATSPVNGFTFGSVWEGKATNPTKPVMPLSPSVAPLAEGGASGGGSSARP